MTRSIWKGPFSEVSYNPNALIQAYPKNSEGASPPRYRKQYIWSRRSTILPRNVDSYVFIYNGKGFIYVKIKPDMVGHKFGEFASTRRIPVHKQSKKKRR